MRAVLIVLGVALERFHWTVYPLAALLVYAAVRMLRGEESESRFVAQQCALCESWLARHSHRAAPARLALSRAKGRPVGSDAAIRRSRPSRLPTLCRVDSIPAVLSVTRDPFLVYTSNIFALLGLRSLYFLLAGVVRKLRFLRVGLALMLMLAAAKLSTAEFFHAAARLVGRDRRDHDRLGGCFSAISRTGARRELYASRRPAR